jgi:hypothetical protein
MSLARRDEVPRIFSGKVNRDKRIAVCDADFCIGTKHAAVVALRPLLG